MNDVPFTKMQKVFIYSKLVNIPFNFTDTSSVLSQSELSLNFPEGEPGLNCPSGNLMLSSSGGEENCR